MTSSFSVVLGLIPTSTRMGPTDDRYRTPKPGVTAPFPFGNPGLVFWREIGTVDEPRAEEVAE